MTVSTRPCLAALVLFCAFHATVSRAQQTGPLPAPALQTLDTITTTAPSSADLPAPYAGGQVARGGRLGMLGNRDFMETPFSVSGYTETLIRNHPAQTVSEILAKTDPSVFTSSGKGIPQDDYTIRGFPVRNADVALNGLYGILPHWRISPEFAERLEVHKGPSAMLNGMPPGGSVGGAINLIPKRAPDQSLARVTGSYVSDAQFGTHLDLGRRFGQERQFGLRVNGVWRDGDTPIDHQSWRNQLLALGLDWRLHPSLRLSADVFHKKERGKGSDRGISLAPGVNLPAPPHYRTLLTPDWTFADSTDKAAMLRLDADLNHRLAGHFSYGASKTDYDSLSNINQIVLDAAGTFRTRFQHQRRVLDKQAADAGLRLHVDTGPVGHELALNAAWFHEDTHTAFRRAGGAFDTVWITNIYNPTWPGAIDGSFSRVNPSRTAESRLFGLALADTMAFADERVLLTLGVRHQNVRSAAFNGATGVRTADYNESAITPSAAVLVKVNAQWSVYANSVQGLSQGATAPNTAVNAGEVFPPYKSRQYELGVKTDQEGLGMSLSAFEIKRPSSYTDPVSLIFSFGGEQRNRGLEWGFFGELWKSLRLTGGIAYTDARLSKTAGGVDQGNYATVVPKWQAKLGLEHDVAALSGLTVSANVLSVSKQYLDNANTRSVPGRTVLDMGLRYDVTLAGRTLELRAMVTNLMNKPYWAGTLSSGRGAPRTWLLSVSTEL